MLTIDRQLSCPNCGENNYFNIGTCGIVRDGNHVEFMCGSCIATNPSTNEHIESPHDNLPNYGCRHRRKHE